ncbi:MAG: hypothetical protein Ct9H300mP2_2350 [Candidatus Neomarinimicrobiota bacterium]|nr:MAG: hypothetical protein Ct9H300mP2_2350 [Candidatus Neomarinimicrobiota bacterium]
MRARPLGQNLSPVSGNRNADFDTLSGDPIDLCYFPVSPENGYMEKLGFFPVNTLIRVVSIRTFIVGNFGQCASFPVMEDPKKQKPRFKLLLGKGQTGLSVAYDMPTLMGYDPNPFFFHRRSRKKWC